MKDQENLGSRLMVNSKKVVQSLDSMVQDIIIVCYDAISQVTLLSVKAKRIINEKSPAAAIEYNTISQFAELLPAVTRCKK